MKFVKSEKYKELFTSELLMGPNPIKMLEELTRGINISPDMRVLDLGCGKGLTTIFLAKEFGAQVFAFDLWITAAENYRRFRALGLDDRVIPIHGDANDMPFAEEYFDAVISVDSYNYFGREENFWGEKLLPLVKPGGTIALAFPGLKEELPVVPDEMLLSWTPEDIGTMHSLEWWRALLEKSDKAVIDSIFEMECFDEAWADWLASENEYAVNDAPAMKAGAGKYMNLTAITARRK